MKRALRTLGAVAVSATAIGGVLVARSAGPGMSYVGTSTAAALLCVAVSSALGAASILVRSNVVAAFTLVLAALWSIQGFAGWAEGPPAAVVLGAAAAVCVVPMAIAIIVTQPAPPARQSSETVLVWVAVAWASGAATVVVLFRDPFFDPTCWQACGANPLLVANAAQVVDFTERMAPWVLAALTVGAALVAIRRLSRVRGVTRSQFLAVAVAGLSVCVVLTSGALLGTRRPETANDDWYLGLEVLASTSMLGLGIALAWPAIRAWLAARAIRRLVADVAAGPSPGTLGAALATIAGDPTLTVAYRHGDAGGYVGADGTRVDFAGKSVVPVERNGSTIALIAHDPAVTDSLEQEFRPSLVLAFENERLRAEALARVEELRTSRSEIIESGDAERRRIERDLHDGVQSRLLALSLELRTALATVPTDEPRMVQAITGALCETADALREIRVLANGIFPAILGDAGLGAALRSLAEIAETPLTLDHVSDERYPAAVETTAYLVVAAAVGENKAPMRVSVERCDGSLVIRLTGGEPGPRLAEIVDRVHTLDGSVTVNREISPSVVEVVVPCA